MQVPAEWPPEVASVYEPIRVLGTGGFASVILARRRQGQSKQQQQQGDDSDLPPEYAAMKIVGSKNSNRTEIGYAHRELDILRELTHPNIMRLLEYWEPAPCLHKCAAVMALTYSKGPTVEQLLQHGGCLSLVFARVVIAQLVDAVCYLHSRAVVHRDIKPDNLIVTGATSMLQQDEIWKDQDEQETGTDWSVLVKKWHLTLIDFGFARALTPNDMSKKPPPLPQSKESNNSKSSRDDELNRSITRRFTRRMSALGNRAYAAPEITKGVLVDNNPSGHGAVQLDITKTLSDHVSRYGILVDEYALGNTMKYCLTGVPPNEDVNEVIALENNPIVVLGRLLCCSKPNAENGERQKQYRNYYKIPVEVLRLIKGLTHYDPNQRTSVRMARRYPYVDDVLEGEPPDLVNKIDYLEIALRPNEINEVTADETNLRN